MQKELKQNFIQLPLNTFKKKLYTIPHFLFQTKLQRNQKNLQQIKKLIESQQYEYIGQVSQQRSLYCCKQKTNDRLVLIEIKEVGSKNNKNIYLSVNLTPALKKDIRKYFMLKNWKILDKIYIQDERGQSGLVMLEYNFVQSDLRNYIKRRYELDQKIQNKEITKICQDIIQNLCYYHLQSTAILDIRPQTILLEDGKWFILHGDNSVTNKSTEFGSSMSKSVGFKPVSCMYLSPIMYQSFIKNEMSLTHNAYKSDVYSLGLIIWQLLSIGTVEPSQIKSRLQNRKQAYVIGIKQQKYFNIRQKIIIKNNKSYVVPNILRMMLQQNEDKRNYIVEICLSVNFTSSLFNKILVPFQKFFKKQVIDINSSSRKKIQYPHVSMEYQGETISLHDEIIKHGRGIIVYNNVKVFDGEWQNNLPNGKCSISFSQMWNYEGMVQRGKLNGQGVLTFNGIRIGGTKWMHNLEQEVVTNYNSYPEYGYYMVHPQTLQEQGGSINRNKKKHSSQLMNITNTHFNMTGAHMNNNMNQTMGDISKMNLTLNEGTINHKTHGNINHLSNQKHQYKIFFEQLYNNKSRYVINMSRVQRITEINRLIEILLDKKMFLYDKVCEVELYQKMSYSRYQSQPADLIRIALISYNHKVNNSNNGYNQQTNNSNSFNMSNGNKFNKRNSVNNIFNMTESKSYIEPKQVKFIKRQSKSINPKQTGKIFPHSQTNPCSQFTQNYYSNAVYYIDLIIPLNTSLTILNKLLTHFSITLINIPSLKSANMQNVTSEFNPFILQSLNLSSSSLNQDLFRDIIQSGIHVQSLNLSKCPNLNDLAIKYLSQSHTIQSALTQLHLEGLKITNQSLQQLKYFTSLKRLKYLNLSHCNKLTNQKIAQFLSDQRLSSLQTLQIAGLPINHRGLEKIVNDGKLNSLQKLNIGSCHQLTETTLIELIKSPQLSNLKSLECYSTTIKDIFMDVMASQQKQSRIPALSHINLSGSINLTVYGISKYLVSKNSKNIISLNLSNLDITDDFLQLMGKRNLLNPQLIQLNLSSCYKVTDKSVRQILKSQKLVELKKLDLSKTNVSNDTLIILSQSTQRKLEQIKFNKCNKMNDTGFQRFLSALNNSNSNNIKKLQINGTSIRQTFFYLLGSDKINIKIEELFISQCKEMDEKALCHLLSSKRMSQMRLIDISNNKFSNKVIQTINKNPYLSSHLIHIIMNNCFNHKGQQLSNISIPNLVQKNLYHSKSILKNSPQDLSRSSLLLKISQLQINNHTPQIQTLFASHYIVNLNKLTLKWQEVSLSLQNLSNNLTLNNFKQLSLLGSKFDELKFIQLIKSSTLKSLQVLNLSWTDISNQTLYAISNSQFMNSLRSLNLSKCSNFNDKGLIKFILSNKVNLLTSLDLRSTLITNTSLQALSKSKHLKSLAKLVCRSCPNISDSGFKEYLSSGNCSTLRQFDVGWTRVQGNIFSFITKSKTLQLSSLRISGLRNVDFQLNKLLQSVSISGLQQLELNFTQMSISTIQALINSKYLQTIQKLQLLGFDFISNEYRLLMLIKLLECANMSKMNSLKLTLSKCGQKWVQKILDTIKKNLHMLQKLSLVKVDQHLIEKARKIFKKCEISNQE